MEEYRGSKDRVNYQKHIAFLNYWISRYFFYTRSVHVAKKYVPLSTQLHEGRKIFLSKFILFGLYESLGLACEYLKERENPVSLQIGGPIRLLQLWLNATLQPSLKTRVPPNPEVEVEGLRLAKLTSRQWEICLSGDLWRLFRVIL